jgi:glycosyltransferase involved in cell wall biosynthesis
MKICMICSSYPPQEVTCGVGDYTRCLAEELVQQGEDVVVLTSDRYRGETGGPVTVLPRVRAWTIGEALRFTSSEISPPVDLIHLQYTPDLYGQGLGFKLLPLLARIRSGPPVVITFHTLVGGSLRSRVVAPLLLLTARWSISANEEVSAVIRRRLPWLAGRCTEIPIGANIPTKPGGMPRGARAAFGLPQEGPVLVHFGLIYPGKGLETLFAALAKLLFVQPHMKLAIVGDNRMENIGYLEDLKGLAERLGVASAVMWMGHRSGEEVSRILSAADIFVVPYDDGVSIRRGSLMAGLAHGRPVVSTVSTLPSAYLRDGDNIALVPPKDAAALASRIASLLAKPEEAACLGKAALAVAERFSWSVIAQETRNLYARVLRR